MVLGNREECPQEPPPLILPNSPFPSFASVPTPHNIHKYLKSAYMRGMHPIISDVTPYQTIGLKVAGNRVLVQVKAARRGKSLD